MCNQNFVFDLEKILNINEDGAQSIEGATQNTKSEIEKLDYVNNTAIKVSAFGLSLWVFQRGIQEFLTTEQKYKFVVTQIFAVVFGVISLFSARTSNEPFYIKIQTMLKTNFLIVSLCYVLIAITYSLTIMKPKLLKMI